MKDLEFYEALSNPLSGLQDDTVAALCELFTRVEKLERAKNTEQQLQPDNTDSPVAG